LHGGRIAVQSQTGPLDRIRAAGALLARPQDLDAANDVADLLAVSPPLGLVYSDPTATLGAVIVSIIRPLCAGMAGNTDAGTGALLELGEPQK